MVALDKRRDISKARSIPMRKDINLSIKEREEKK